MSLLELFEQGDVPILQHPGLKEQLLKRIAGTGGTGAFLADVRLMGMVFDAPYGRFRMSHYVGTDWIDKRRKMAMAVRPKVRGLDFQQMLMQCFRCPEASQNLDELLYIRTEDEPIEIDAEDFQLEPLLVVFFLNLLQRIVRKGLKSDYIEREERLDSKIKGKIKMNRYITCGVANGRNDRVNCYFEEYGVDCLENRILKSALKLVHQILLHNRDGLGEQASILNGMYNRCAAAFASVSDQVSLQDLRCVHVEPTYRDYRAIMPFARMIILKQGRCLGLNVTTGRQMFPPFIIDMSVLFERYVYSLLSERYGSHSIGYQVAAGDSVLAFTKADERMLLDTNFNSVGTYGRCMHIRRKLGLASDDSYICPYVIIYPSSAGSAAFSHAIADFHNAPDRLLDGDAPAFSALEVVQDYLRYYKLGVKLPLRQK